MTSFAIDLAAIAWVLRGKALEPHSTEQHSTEQHNFIAWYEANSAKIAKITDALACLSSDFGVQNEFLVDNGQPSAFGPFYGLGIASIREVRVRCQAQNTAAGIELGEYSFRAFEAEADLFRVAGRQHPYIRLTGQGDRMIWIVPVNEKPSGPLELFTMAQLGEQLSVQEKQVVRVPLVDLAVRSSLPWLTHLSVRQGKGNGVPIVATLQSIRIRMDGRSSGRPQSAEHCLTIQQPFVMCIGRVGQIPQVAAYVDLDAWRAPDILS